MPVKGFIRTRDIDLCPNLPGFQTPVAVKTLQLGTTYTHFSLRGAALRRAH